MGGLHALARPLGRLSAAGAEGLALLLDKGLSSPSGQSWPLESAGGSPGGLGSETEGGQTGRWGSRGAAWPGRCALWWCCQCRLCDCDLEASATGRDWVRQPGGGGVPGALGNMVGERTPGPWGKLGNCYLRSVLPATQTAVQTPKT